MNTDFFKFEKGDRDFPFYNANPKISQGDWIILLFSMILAFGVYLFYPNGLISAILFPVIMLIPLLYYLKGDIGALFTRLSANDLALVVILFVGYLIYAIILGEILANIGLMGNEAADNGFISWFSTFTLIFSLMGEELLKLIPFLLFLRIFFKYTHSRKFSMIFSMLVVMLGFGLLHATDLSAIPSVILIQGLGSIFEFLAYFRSKNLLMSYLTHLLTDVFIFVVTLVGVI